MSLTLEVDGVAVNHSKILNENLKNELIVEAEEEEEVVGGCWHEFGISVCCVDLLLVAVAIVEIFYIWNETKKKIKRKKVTEEKPSKKAAKKNERKKNFKRIFKLMWNQNTNNHWKKNSVKQTKNRVCMNTHINA